METLWGLSIVMDDDVSTFRIIMMWSYPIENNRGRIGGRWWAAVALRGALPEAHRGGAGEMSALSWEISTAAHRGPPKIYINKDKKGICGPFLLKFMNLFV